MDSNLIVIDWLSFRCQSMDVECMKGYLGLEHCVWSPGSGFYGFRSRSYTVGISICSGHSSLEGVLVEMSGQGCRAFETFSGVDWSTIFRDILEDDDFTVTRLDIAFDDHSGCIPIRKLFSDVGCEFFVSRMKSKSVIREDHPGRVGQTIYFGSPQSEIRFRIYDKAFERGLDDGSHWVRFEMQLRREMAHSFIQQLEDNHYDFGSLFASIVSNYIRIVRPPKNRSDTNKRRWETAPYWSKLIGEALPLSLFVKKDLEYNRYDCERYVYGQAGNSVAALIELDGLEAFAHNLYKHKSQKVPDRIRNMIEMERLRSDQNGGDT